MAKFMKGILSLFICLVGLTSFSQKALNIFGGKDRDVYLGCLNCDSHNSNSIWNQYGTFGSKYNAKSIWNNYGNYGSGYSNISPFNSYASDPPVIVDDNGAFYGYFTLNKYHNNRADFDLVLTIYEYYDLIRDDVSKWHDKIFQ